MVKLQLPVQDGGPLCARTTHIVNQTKQQEIRSMFNMIKCIGAALSLNREVLQIDVLLRHESIKSKTTVLCGTVKANSACSC